MFYAKIFKAGKNVVLGMCDEQLLSKKIKGDKIELEVSKSFYGEREVKEEKSAVSMMERCTIGNLVGERIVKLAEKHGFITKENIISIGGVPHAQFVKL